MKISKNIYSGISFAILLFLLFTVWSGCRGTFDRPQETRPTETRDDGGSVYNPIGLPEDAAIVPEKYPILASVDSTAATDSVSVFTVDAIDSLIDDFETYRIQLFTSNTYGPADREKEVAGEVFDRKVYLDYEVPYYKVRVGDFADRADAEAYLPAAIEAGYSNAWVVKVTVNVQNIEEMYDEDIPPLLDSMEVHPDDTGAIDDQY